MKTVDSELFVKETVVTLELVDLRSSDRLTCEFSIN